MSGSRCNRSPIPGAVCHTASSRLPSIEIVEVIAVEAALRSVAVARFAVASCDQAKEAQEAKHSVIRVVLTQTARRDHTVALGSDYCALVT